MRNILDDDRFNQLKGCKVLIICSEASFNYYISMTAKSLSARECVSIKNTVEATHALKQEKYDMIFLDEGCKPLAPEIFSKYLRFSEGSMNFSTPIIILSKKENQSAFDSIVLKRYAQNVLEKPFQMWDLNDSISLVRNSPKREFSLV